MAVSHPRDCFPPDAKKPKTGKPPAVGGVASYPQGDPVGEEREGGAAAGLSEEEGENPLDSSLEEAEVPEGSPLATRPAADIGVGDRERGNQRVKYM